AGCDSRLLYSLDAIRLQPYGTHEYDDWGDKMVTRIALPREPVESHQGILRIRPAGRSITLAALVVSRAVSKRFAESSMIRGLVLGMVLGVIGAIGAAYWYFSSGRAPVATSAPEMPFERRFARLGLHAYLDKLPHAEAPVPVDEKNLLAGAKVYKEHCAVC